MIKLVLLHVFSETWVLKNEYKRDKTGPTKKFCKVVISKLH